MFLPGGNVERSHGHVTATWNRYSLTAAASRWGLGGQSDDSEFSGGVGVGGLAAVTADDDSVRKAGVAHEFEHDVGVADEDEYEGQPEYGGHVKHVIGESRDGHIVRVAGLFGAMKFVARDLFLPDGRALTPCVFIGRQFKADSGPDEKLRDAAQRRHRPRDCQHYLCESKTVPRYARHQPFALQVPTITYFVFFRSARLISPATGI